MENIYFLKISDASFSLCISITVIMFCSCKLPNFHSPGSLSSNCFNIPCPFFQNCLDLSFTNSEYSCKYSHSSCAFFLCFITFTFSCEVKVFLFFFFLTAVSADKIKNKFEFKTNEKVSELKLLALICLIHFMHVHYV